MAVVGFGEPLRERANQSGVRRAELGCLGVFGADAAALLHLVSFLTFDSPQRTRDPRPASLGHAGQGTDYAPTIPGPPQARPHSLPEDLHAMPSQPPPLRNPGGTGDALEVRSRGLSGPSHPFVQTPGDRSAV